MPRADSSFRQVTFLLTLVPIQSARSTFVAILRVFLLATVLIRTTEPAIAQQTGCAGATDPSFTPFGLNRISKVYVDGNETIVAALGSIIRFREDSSFDPTFFVTYGKGSQDPTISTILKDAASNWFIAGQFTDVNLLPRNSLARLLPNGDPDLAFSSQSLPANSSVTALALQADGRLLVAGSASSVFLLRLDQNGDIDPTFNAGLAPDGRINTLAVQSDGSILVGGEFKNFNNQPRNQLCRLSPTGALDQSFVPARYMPWVFGIKILPDAKMLIHAGSDRWDFPLIQIPIDGGVEPPPPNNALVRLNADGSLDKIFSNIPPAVNSVALQPDGKLLIAGSFFDESNINTLCKRLLPDGSEDPSFVSSFPLGDEFSGSATSISLDAKQRIILSGVYGSRWGQSYGPFLQRLVNDNQPCPTSFSFETNHLLFVETNGAVSIPIIRSGDLTGSATVQLANLDGNAYYSRYFLVETNIVFGPGVSRQNAILSMTNNQMVERSQVFTVALRKVTPLSNIGRIDSISITIADASSYDIPGLSRSNILR
jgi:uncharacterized delta-60 repeat protein